MKRTFWIMLFTSTLCVLVSSCKVGRFVLYNFADIKDNNKFQERALTSAPIKFEFHATEHQKIPKTINNVPFEKYLKDNKTVAFIIIKSDTIQYEKYFYGYDKETVVPSFSMAKSVTSILIGCAIDDGLINSIDDPITDYIPELKTNGFEKVTIKHLMQMKSGIKFNEGYFNPFSEAASFYYGRNLRKEISKMKLEREPGSAATYSSGDTQILGLVLDHALKGKTVTQYLQDKLWTPLGMESAASWSIDKKKDGLEKTFCCLNSTARDYAKIGRLYKNNGNWNGKQIVSQKWVEESIKLDTTNGNTKMHHYQWWFPSMNGEDFSAEGHLGQYIYVNPSRDVIIVRLGKRDKGDPWWKIYAALASVYNDSKSDVIDLGMHLLHPQNIFDLEKSSMVRNLRRDIDKNGVELAAKNFRKINLEPDHDLVNHEGELILLGNKYLGRKQAATALAIFKLNIDMHPNSALAYYANGKALLLTGDTTNAITSLRKSLLNNPFYSASTDKLTELNAKTSDLPKAFYVDSKVQENYLNRYYLGNQDQVSISKNGNELLITFNDSESQYELYPIHKDYFLAIKEKKAFGDVTFNLDKDGIVESLYVNSHRSLKTYTYYSENNPKRTLPNQSIREHIAPNKYADYNGEYIFTSGTDTSIICVSIKNEIAVLAYSNDVMQENIIASDSIHFLNKSASNKYVFQYGDNGNITGLQATLGAKEAVIFNKVLQKAPPQFMLDLENNYMVGKAKWGYKWEFNYSDNVLRVYIPNDDDYVMIPISNKEYVFPNWPECLLKFTTNKSNSIILKIEYIESGDVLKLKASK